MDGTSLIPLESINAVEVFTGQHLDESGRQREAQVGPTGLHPGEPAALQHGGQAASYRLDLGKLGHALGFACVAGCAKALGRALRDG